MIEIIIFIGGLFIGYIVKKQKPTLAEQLLKKERGYHKICEDEKAELSDENTMLKNPKRLIKEFKGDSGSSTYKLLNDMKGKLTLIEDNISDSTRKKAKLAKDKKDLISEVKIKQEALNTQLQKIYDKAIIDIDKQLKKARDGNIEDKNKVLQHLKNKSEALNDKNI
jgi:hypothetical protein